MNETARKPKHFLKKIGKDRAVIAGGFLMAIVILSAILAPVISPYDPYVQDVAHRYQAPWGKGHLLGTDSLGRDLLSRIIWGSRISLTIGLGAVLFGCSVGGLIGLAAGYLRGRIDAGIGWMTDVLMSFPTEVLAILVCVAFGASSVTAMIAIGVVFVPRYIRLVRASTLSISENTYIEASRAQGQSSFKIMVRHILPNLMGETVVMTSLWIATAIRTEATLGFLGLGAQPPEPSWGVISRDGLDSLFYAPWLSLAPGLAIFITSMGFNLVGDSFRDALDPKLQN
jgi:peptide/nickel transport system permease protein